MGSLFSVLLECGDANKAASYASASGCSSGFDISELWVSWLGQIAEGIDDASPWEPVCSERD